MVTSPAGSELDGRFVELLRATAAAADLALVRARPTAASVALLEEAITVFERLVATASEPASDDDLDDEPIRGRRCPNPGFGWGSLTPREAHVVELVAEGLSTPEIGRRLYVSPDTVKTHLTHVFAKLGVSSRVEVAIAAIQRRHLVEPPVALVS